jgi:nitronate monooxygenase
MWPDRRLLDLLGTEHPIIQAPMGGAVAADMVIAVCEAGGLGSLPAAMLSPDDLRAQVEAIRAGTAKPFNLNFFCHDAPRADPAREAAWFERLAAHFAALGLDVPQPGGKPPAARFDATWCGLVEALKPPVVSFHFGLPDSALLERLKAAGCTVLCSATTVAEARWLAERGADAVIAQGSEAGGHRGTFLGADLAEQPATLALVRAVADAVPMPVIAAGGIMDGRAVAQAMAQGAAGIQLGTAYLFTPEAAISDLYRQALRAAGERSTVVANVFSGRPARAMATDFVRELGPINDAVPDFPLGFLAAGPLKAKAEAQGSSAFSFFWAGEGVGSGRTMGAGALTRLIAEETLAHLQARAPETGRAHAP